MINHKATNEVKNNLIVKNAEAGLIYDPYSDKYIWNEKILDIVIPISIHVNMHIYKFNVSFNDIMYFLEDTNDVEVYTVLRSLVEENGCPIEYSIECMNSNNKNMASVYSIHVSFNVPYAVLYEDGDDYMDTYMCRRIMIKLSNVTYFGRNIKLSSDSKNVRDKIMCSIIIRNRSLSIMSCDYGEELYLGEDDDELAF